MSHGNYYYLNLFCCVKKLIFVNPRHINKKHYEKNTSSFSNIPCWAVSFILFLSGCSSGDDPETPPDKLITVEIPATQTSLLFNQEGGTASIN